MKKIIIPNLKTSCGEFFYGSFYLLDDKINIELLSKGSQLLDYICLFFTKIVNDRPIKYLLLSKKIFWRMNVKPILGSRKDMVEETLDMLIDFISLSLKLKD